MSINKTDYALHKSNKPCLSLNLRELEPEQIILITFGEGAKQNSITVRIKKPAGPGPTGKDAAIGQIIAVEFERETAKMFMKAGVLLPPLGEECALVAACTKDENKRIGAKDLHFHHLMKDKHFWWSTETTGEKVWILDQKVTNIQLIPTEHAEKFSV